MAALYPMRRPGSYTTPGDTIRGSILGRRQGSNRGRRCELACAPLEHLYRLAKPVHRDVHVVDKTSYAKD